MPGINLQFQILIYNMHLIVAIEDHYDIRFELEEIQSLKNVGELYNCINKYLEKKD